MKKIETTCQVCGGPLGISLDGKTIRCPYCESVFFIDDPDYAKMQASVQRDRKAAVRTKENLYDYLDRSCDEIRDAEPEAFLDREKIRKGLGVSDEYVFLIHDDTALGSGKNGFAVTDRGFFCRGLSEEEVEFTSWEKLKSGRRVKLDGFYLKQGERHLAYFSSLKGRTRELLARFGTDIQRKLQEDGLSVSEQI